MSKLAIILCAVFFTSATNIPSWQNWVVMLQNSQHDFKQLIDTQIITMHKNQKEFDEKGREFRKKVSQATTEFSFKFQKDVKDIADEIYDRYFYLDWLAEFNNITGCPTFLRRLYDEVPRIINNTNVCTIGVQESSTEYIAMISKLFKEALFNLTEIQQTSLRFGDSANSTLSTVNAVFYLDLAMTNSTATSQNLILQPTTWTNRMDLLLESLPSALAKCKNLNGFPIFRQTSIFDIRNSAKCISDRLGRNVTEHGVVNIHLLPLR